MTHTGRLMAVANCSKQPGQRSELTATLHLLHTSGQLPSYWDTFEHGDADQMKLCVALYVDLYRAGQHEDWVFVEAESPQGFCEGLRLGEWLLSPHTPAYAREISCNANVWRVSEFEAEEKAALRSLPAPVISMTTVGGLPCAAVHFPPGVTA